MFPWSTLINHRNDVKMFNDNFAVKAVACNYWFHLSFEDFNVISMVDISTDHGKFLSGFYLGYLRGRSFPQKNAQLPSPPQKKYIYIVIITAYVTISEKSSRRDEVSADNVTKLCLKMHQIAFQHIFISKKFRGTYLRTASSPRLFPKKLGPPDP